MLSAGNSSVGDSGAARFTLVGPLAAASVCLCAAFASWKVHEQHPEIDDRMATQLEEAVEHRFEWESAVRARADRSQHDNRTTQQRTGGAGAASTPNSRSTEPAATQMGERTALGERQALVASTGRESIAVDEMPTLDQDHYL